MDSLEGLHKLAQIFDVSEKNRKILKVHKVDKFGTQIWDKMSFIVICVALGESGHKSSFGALVLIHSVHIVIILELVGLVSRLLVQVDALWSEDWGQSGARPPQPPLPAPHTSTPQRPTSPDPHHHLCHPAIDWLPLPCPFSCWTLTMKMD